MTGRVQLDIFVGRHWSPPAVAPKYQLVRERERERVFEPSHERAADAADLTDALRQMAKAVRLAERDVRTGPLARTRRTPVEFEVG